MDTLLKWLKRRKNAMKSFFKGSFGYFFSGFVFWFPVGIIVVVIGYVFGNLETVGKNVLEFFVPPDLMHQGFGLVFWLMLFFLTGLIVKKTPIGKVLFNVPVLGLFFREGGEIMTLKRLLHLAPCLFLFSPTSISYGWIISMEKVKTNGGKENLILFNVYYPNFPSLITGQVFALRKENIMRLANPSREVIDLFLFAVRSPESIRYLPWENETEEDFLKRAKAFGLNKGAE